MSKARAVSPHKDAFFIAPADRKIFAVASADQIQRLILLATLQGLAQAIITTGNDSLITQSGAKTLILISAAFVLLWYVLFTQYLREQEKSYHYHRREYIVNTPQHDTPVALVSTSTTTVHKRDPIPVFLVVLDTLQRIVTLNLVYDLTQSVPQLAAMSTFVALNAVMSFIRLVYTRRCIHYSFIWCIEWSYMLVSVAEKTIKVAFVIYAIVFYNYMSAFDTAVVSLCLCSTLAGYFVTSMLYLAVILEPVTPPGGLLWLIVQRMYGTDGMSAVIVSPPVNPQSPAMLTASNGTLTSIPTRTATGDGRAKESGDVTANSVAETTEIPSIHEYSFGGQTSVMYPSPAHSIVEQTVVPAYTYDHKRYSHLN